MKRISTFFQKNEKWLTPTMLFGGFVLDNFTLRSSAQFVENLFIAIYLTVLMLAVLLLHKLQEQETKSVRSLEIQSLLSLVILFIFGGLFSALTVFYIKSASIFASWPFLLLLFGGMIATEYFKKHFSQFLVQFVTIYFLVFTYLIVLIPLFVRSINVWVFLLSGVFGLGVIFGYGTLFQKIVPSLFKKREQKIAGAIIGVFALINVLYFSNVIPPIPLVLKDSGVYKSVVRTDNNYSFAYFNSDFSFTKLKTEYSVSSGSPVYFYSSVYAPVKFRQNIVHEWQKKNTQGNWITVSTIKFPIYGGNDLGYRGYSVSNQVTKGEWRVLVKTDRGQTLGSKGFIIK